MIVFFVSGLWHGAAWTFVIWGGMHGVILIFENLSGWNRYVTQNPLYKLFRMAATFTVVFFTWMFFRANTLHDGWYVLRSVFNIFDWHIGDYMSRTRELLALSRYELILSVVAIVILLGIDFLQERGGSVWQVIPQNRAVRWLVYASSIILILFFAEFGSQQFIYFQF